jgi:septal ring factor EnvC (AmiA/AmiB activator)
MKGSVRMSEELLNKIFEKLVSIEAEAQSFRGEVKKEFEAVNKEFETVKKEFEAVNKEFETVKKEFEAVNKEFETVKKEFKAVNKEFETVNKKLGSIQEQVVKNSESITIMINGQNKGEHQFLAFNKRLHTVETEIERLNK